MKKYWRIVPMTLSLIFTAVWTVPCSAAENALKEVFQDSIYGGVTGTLIGAAVMAFSKRAGDHLDYMGYGAAGGALVGAAVGFTIVNRSLAEINNGKLKLAIPAIIPDYKETNSNKAGEYTFTAELLSGKF